MKQILKVCGIFLFLITLSCSIGVLKQNEIEPWLLSVSGNAPAELDISGKWYDAKGNKIFGWGEGYFRQEKNKVTGVIGNYNVKGTVSGKHIYLVFIYGGAVYYTARLEMIEDGLLAGNYFDADDKTQSNGYPTSLAKARDKTIPVTVYNLNNGEILKGEFYWTGLKGKVKLINSKGEKCEGEYITQMKGSSATVSSESWGNIYSMGLGLSSGSRTTKIESHANTNYGSAILVCPDQNILECEYIVNSDIHGSGFCKDKAETTYKFIF